ncbi:ABC transporter permease [Kocuria sp.]|uniref:ABC transporter permease n=1 Tax=Kocuria sp. TaxID=1871328 RepID=UPI0026E017C8|nr:ABC transporter permease [Kocuria sp.]MDO5617203.1 ABC transporter permease [Kocuria sp.]
MPDQNSTPETAARGPVMQPAGREVPTAEHFVAPVLDDEGRAGIETQLSDKPSSLWRDAWKSLRKNPIFIISALLMLFVLFVALFPTVFTSASPDSQCMLSNANGAPQAGHPLGFTNQGCDILARVVHGAPASLLVGFGTILGVLVVGILLGSIAGFFGGWVDSIISRVMDIFFAIPLILGAIVLMAVPIMRQNAGIVTLAIVLTIFGWPQMARITRGAVMEVRTAEFITAARSLGMSKMGILFKHVLPNAAGPIIVVATISLGIFIVVEATLSFLGIGLPPSILSWGHDISAARPQLRTNPGALFWPSLMLSITVLSFMMLGDALRDALDPKGRTR